MIRKLKHRERAREGERLREREGEALLLMLIRMTATAAPPTHYTLKRPRGRKKNRKKHLSNTPSDYISFFFIRRVSLIIMWECVTIQVIKRACVRVCVGYTLYCMT